MKLRTLIGLVLVPVLVAGGLLWGSWADNSRLRTVEAAVVNLDEPVTLNGVYIPLGRQMTANLVDSDRAQNLSWVMAAEDDARAGLASGRFAAMVIIPEDFSAAATSYGSDEVDQARRATVSIETSPVAGVADATLGKVVAHAAATTLNETLTSTYLEQIYIGFSDQGKQFVTLADGSDELATGAEELADGIKDASLGADQLSDGASELASGMKTMKTETAPLPKGARKLADGAGELADGVKQYTTGVGGLVDQTLASLGQQKELVEGVGQLSDGASGLAGGLGQYQSALSAQAASASQAASGISALAGQLDPANPDPALLGKLAGAVKQACDQDLMANPAAMTSVIAGCVGGLEGSAMALKGAAAGLAQKDPDTGQSLISGSQALSGGLSQLQSQLSAAGGGEDPTKDLKKLKSAGTALRNGTSELAKGADTLADGLPALVAGIGKAADGAGQLAGGVDQLASGLQEAADGSAQLAEGAREMADGIAEGSGKIPSYTTAERENLADVVAGPISTENLQGTAGAGLGWASLLLVLATWLGAMATFLVTRAVHHRVLTSSRSSAALVADALAPGLLVVGIQAVLLTGIGQLALGLPFPKLLAVAGLLVLSGVTFVVINHALVAWAGGIGRLISLGFVVLAAASAISSAAPAFFDVARTFSPITPALDAIRAVLTDSSGAVNSALVLTGWLILGLVASATAVLRARTTTLTELVARHG